MEPVLGDVERLVITITGAAITALVVYAFKVLRTWLGIVESDSNEGEIRRAAVSEAGKLLSQGTANDAGALINAAAKIAADLHPAVRAEGYDTGDIKDMIIGAVGTMFPPANLLKFLK